MDIFYLKYKFLNCPRWRDRRHGSCAIGPWVARKTEAWAPRQPGQVKSAVQVAVVGPPRRMSAAFLAVPSKRGAHSFSLSSCSIGGGEIRPRSSRGIVDTDRAPCFPIATLEFFVLIFTTPCATKGSIAYLCVINLFKINKNWCDWSNVLGLVEICTSRNCHKFIYYMFFSFSSIILI